MSQTPECNRCGIYVHAGPVCCFDCYSKLLDQIRELQNTVQDLSTKLAAYKADSFKAVREMGHHDVAQYYTDPCLSGHTFFWTNGGTESPRFIPDYAVCVKCNKSYREIVG
jgi:hypothetical protein